MKVIQKALNCKTKQLVLRVTQEVMPRTGGPLDLGHDKAKVQVKQGQGRRKNLERDQDGSGEGVTRDGSKNRSNAESRANNNRPERPSERDNNVRSSSARPTAPVPDYTLEQSSRNRRIHQDATELPPPYQTLDPNRRPSRDELEAQALAQVHAQAHADARAEYMMRQRSRNRDYDPGWYPDMHGFDGVQEHPPMMGPGPGPMMGPGMVDSLLPSRCFSLNKNNGNIPEPTDTQFL